MSTYTDEIRAWQQQREVDLRNPDGWLTLAGLFWLETGESSFGGDETNDIVFPGCSAPRLGRFVVTERSVVVEAEPPGGITHKGAPITRLEVAGTDGQSPAGESPVLAWGTLRWLIIQRAGRWAVRLRDHNHPALKIFAGVDYFPVDPVWQVEAELRPHATPMTVPVPTVLGTINQTASPGTLHFSVNGQPYSLLALGKIEHPLSLIFGDTTNGTETYGSGRFLTVQPPDAAGRVIIDFNRAYNPPCAFTPFATCPLPPAGNRLALAVTAGEKKYGDH